MTAATAARSKDETKDDSVCVCVVVCCVVGYDDDVFFLYAKVSSSFVSFLPHHAAWINCNSKKVIDRDVTVTAKGVTSNKTSHTNLG